MAGKGQNKRKDSDRVVLKTGECQRANGTYHYCWTDDCGKRHFIYAKTLEALREKEGQVERDKHDGIKTEARYVTINELFELWCQIKRGLKKIPLRTTSICIIPLCVRTLGRNESPP